MSEETGLSLTLSETPKTGFVTSRPNYYGDDHEIIVLITYEQNH